MNIHFITDARSTRLSLRSRDGPPGAIGPPGGYDPP